MCTIAGVAKQQTAALSVWLSPERVSKRVLHGGSGGGKFRHRPAHPLGTCAHRGRIGPADGVQSEKRRAGKAADESA